MDGFMKLSRETQIVIGGGVLYFIFSFLNWQQYGPFSQNEWTGIGVLAGLIAIALLVWETSRMFGTKLPPGPVSDGLVSLGLALLLLLVTFITFLTHDKIVGVSTRSWPAWVGLILSIVIAVAAVIRAKGEGVTMPDMGGSSKTSSSMGGGTTDGSTTGRSPMGDDSVADDAPGGTEP